MEKGEIERAAELIEVHVREARHRLLAVAETACNIRQFARQSGLNGADLVKNSLVGKLIALYANDGGAVRYRAEYQRPNVSRAPVSASVIQVAPSSSSPIQDGFSQATALTVGITP